MSINMQNKIKAKSHFVSPKIEIILFPEVDVITASGDDGKLSYEAEGEANELDW